MAVYEQIPIRYEIDLVSTPPVPPIDANTGAAPRFWRGQTVAINGGIFDSSGNPVDLSNIVTLQVILQAASDSLYPLVTKTLTSDDDEINTLITLAGWRNGTQWNFQAILEAADTDQSLEGGYSLAYWMIVKGVTGAGAPIIYSAGPVTIFNAGSDLPVPDPHLTSRHAQTNATGDFTITPTSQLHKEIVTIDGAARTSNAIMGISGIQDGAELTVVLLLPATADIIIDFRNNLVGNPVISTIETGSVLQCRLKYYFDSDLASWVPEIYNLPSP